MSDTVEQTTTAAPSADVVQQTTTVEASPVETQARDQGWVSKEEWAESGRDESEWRPAKEFVDRGELYKSIHSTKRELKQTQIALAALQGHHKLVFEKAHQQAVKDLTMERRQALRMDDVDRVEEIESELEQLKETHVKEAVQFQQATAQAQPVAAPEFDSFIQRNPWYMIDGNLKDEADALGFVYLNKPNVDKSPAKVLEYVEKRMKEKFPDKFGVKRAAPNAVASVSRSGVTRSKSDTFDLSDSEREVMNTFVRSGVMTKEQYMNDLKKIKERS